MTTNQIVDSSFTAIINAPIEKIDIPSWCFNLSETEYQGCSPAHIAAGFTTAPDGRRMSMPLPATADFCSWRDFRIPRAQQAAASEKTDRFHGRFHGRRSPRRARTALRTASASAAMAGQDSASDRQKAALPSGSLNFRCTNSILFGCGDRI